MIYYFQKNHAFKKSRPVRPGLTPPSVKRPCIHDSAELPLIKPCLQNLLKVHTSNSHEWKGCSLSFITRKCVPPFKIFLSPRVTGRMPGNVFPFRLVWPAWSSETKNPAAKPGISPIGHRYVTGILFRKGYIIFRNSRIAKLFSWFYFRLQLLND